MKVGVKSDGTSRMDRESEELSLSKNFYVSVKKREMNVKCCVVTV